MLDVIEQLRNAGFALHWLNERKKAPVENNWSTAPVYSVAELRKKYHSGLNLGFRPGEFSKIGDLFAHVIDVDVRVEALADEAFDRLAELFPRYDELPEVQSGSGGESRHYHFLTERPFRSRKLAHSEGFFVDDEGHKHWNWEIELFGSGKNVVLPPSIHPDTGLPYRWLREYDFDLLEMGLGPVISAEHVESLAPQVAKAVEGNDDDDFLNEVRNAPTDLTTAQVRETLFLLPLAHYCEDHTGWITVGMALHHQFAGSEEGFELWCEFAKKSTKFDAREHRKRWKSFTVKSGGATMRTLIQAAAVERERRDMIEAEAEAEIDDLIGDIADAPDPDAPTVESWRSLLEKNEEGLVKSTLHNAVLIIANDPRTKGLPQINLFSKEVVQRVTPGRFRMAKKGPKGCKQLNGPVWEIQDPVNGDLWSDVRDVSIRNVFEAPDRQGGYGLKMTDRDLHGAINLNARDNAFHPVREYLTKQRWDGRPRVETLFIDYLGAPDTPYTRSVARLFLAAAVTRVFEPGHKFDFAVVLEGLQGKRKTSFIEKLARHWFAELDGDFSETKNMVEVMQGAWILELPELVGFSRSDVRQIKAFISRRTDKARLAYERRAAEYPRQCIFIGSTNDQEYLRDDTGGRRFWPVHCAVSAIDIDRLEREVDQIWAEAYVVYQGMRKVQPTGTLPLYLTDKEAAAEATKLQESRRIESAEDVMAGRIAEWLDMPLADDSGFTDDEAPVSRDVTCVAQLWVECFGRDMASLNQAVSQQVGRAMKKVRGWTLLPSPRKLPKWGSQRAYVRDLVFD